MSSHFELAEYNNNNNNNKKKKKKKKKKKDVLMWKKKQSKMTQAMQFISHLDVDLEH
jgi:hypothetical protein